MAVANKIGDTADEDSSLAGTRACQHQHRTAYMFDRFALLRIRLNTGFRIGSINGH
jgi:hypothetical protein